jgi:hypothetical protein
MCNEHRHAFIYIYIIDTPHHTNYRNKQTKKVKQIMQLVYYSIVNAMMQKPFFLMYTHARIN